MTSSSVTHPAARVSTGRIALWITLTTESVFFVTLLVAYAALRDEADWSLPHTFTRLLIPAVNTTILLVSAFMAGSAVRAVRHNDQTGLRNSLLRALLLGLVFVAGQVFEFNHAGLSIDDQAFGGVFFTLMGFHAVHVLAGVVFLALNLMRANLGDFTSTHYEAVDLGVWFWYYVTLVWFVLFAALYLL